MHHCALTAISKVDKINMGAKREFGSMTGKGNFSHSAFIIAVKSVKAINISLTHTLTRQITFIYQFFRHILQFSWRHRSVCLLLHILSGKYTVGKKANPDENLRSSFFHPCLSWYSATKYKRTGETMRRILSFGRISSLAAEEAWEWR